MNILNRVVAICFLTVFSLVGQVKEIAFTEYDLPNGLHVILHKDNSTPIVAVTVTYHVGSKNEDPERTGFAHFFEHLMFEGSENINRGQIDQLIQNAGGQLNASTTFDRTNYFFVLPSNQLELGLWIESERMLHAKIDSVGVETQRKVVKEERRQSYDNRPYGSIIEQTFKRAYKTHPYRWTPIGSMQYIDKATIEEFREFYRTYYVPDNAVLSIAGDIDIKATKELIGKYFSDIPRGKKTINRVSIPEPRQEAEVRDTVYDNISLPAVIQAYHIPKMGDKDFYALSMLTNLLSSGQSSRLYRQLVDEKRLSVTVGSIPYPLEEPGLYLIYSIAGFGKTADENESLINAELARVQNELLSDEEFEKIKNQAETDFVMEKGQVRGIATSLAEYYMFYKNTNLINDEINRYLSVTKEDIKRVAATYLHAKNRVVLYYLPKKKNNEGKSAQ